MTDLALQRIINNLNSSLGRDSLVGETTTFLRSSLQVDRVVLFYFYREGEGRVTHESVSSRSYSIFGSTGPIDCLHDKYADYYANGQVRAISDMKSDASYGYDNDCSRDLQVRANLVAPVLNANRLWGC